MNEQQSGMGKRESRVVMYKVRDTLELDGGLGDAGRPNMLQEHYDQALVYLRYDERVKRQPFRELCSYDLQPKNLGLDAQELTMFGLVSDYGTIVVTRNTTGNPCGNTIGFHSFTKQGLKKTIRKLGLPTQDLEGMLAHQ